MKDYDLVLVVGYFRTAMSMLSIVKALGKELRIAVLSVSADPAMRHKTGDAHAVFLDLCSKFGADLLSLNAPARTRLLIVQQFPYDDALVKTIQRNLESQEHVGLMTLAMAGLEKHDAFLTQFGIYKVYVPNRRFMNFLLKKRGAQTRYEGTAITEVGLPFMQHQVFPEFTADWIIAAPTLFSFHSEVGKQQFLQSVNQLLDQIPPDDVIVYKSHNGNSLDYFAPRMLYCLAGWIGALPSACRLLMFVQRLNLPWLSSQAARVYTCLLHRSILKRAVPMSLLTPYAGMSLEAFLPGVRKGVIGGLSNTIWSTLYFDLPFYNCVDESFRLGESELLNKRSDALLDLNLQYFGVPFCHGDLTTDTSKQGIIESHERIGNLISAILDDLGRTARNTKGEV